MNNRSPMNRYELHGTTCKRCNGGALILIGYEYQNESNPTVVSRPYKRSLAYECDNRYCHNFLRIVDHERDPR